VTYGTAIMYAVAAVFAAIAAVLLLQLRSPRRSERGRYARLMAGVMCAAFATMLIAYATALWSWSTELTS
jgi:uncharacterized membrane protein